MQSNILIEMSKQKISFSNESTDVESYKSFDTNRSILQGFQKCNDSCRYQTLLNQSRRSELFYAKSLDLNDSHCGQGNNSADSFLQDNNAISNECQCQEQKTNQQLNEMCSVLMRPASLNGSHHDTTNEQKMSLIFNDDKSKNLLFQQKLDAQIMQLQHNYNAKSQRPIKQDLNDILNEFTEQKNDSYQISWFDYKTTFNPYFDKLKFEQKLREIMRFSPDIICFQQQHIQKEDFFELQSNSFVSQQQFTSPGDKMIEIFEKGLTKLKNQDYFDIKLFKENEDRLIHYNNPLTRINCKQKQTISVDQFINCKFKEKRFVKNVKERFSNQYENQYVSFNDEKLCHLMDYQRERKKCLGIFGWLKLHQLVSSSYKFGGGFEYKQFKNRKYNKIRLNQLSKIFKNAIKDRQLLSNKQIYLIQKHYLAVVRYLLHLFNRLMFGIFLCLKYLHFLFQFIKYVFISQLVIMCSIFQGQFFNIGSEQCLIKMLQRHKIHENQPINKRCSQFQNRTPQYLQKNHQLPHAYGQFSQIQILQIEDDYDGFNDLDEFHLRFTQHQNSLLDNYSMLYQNQLSTNGSLEQGIFVVYKIDCDDESLQMNYDKQNQTNFQQFLKDQNNIIQTIQERVVESEQKQKNQLKQGLKQL